MQAAARHSSLGPGNSPALCQEHKLGALSPLDLADVRQREFYPTHVAAVLSVFVDHLEDGVIIIDKSGRVLFLNREAQAILQGRHLRLVNGRLRACAPAGGIALCKLIADCVAKGSGDSLRLGSDEDTLLIAASALPPETGMGNDPVVLLRLIDPAGVRPPTKEALQAYFNLTATEAVFALEMLAGHDLAASAARRGVRLNTARAHLRRIFEKTETRRQAALMRLLLLCPKPIVEQSASATGSKARSEYRLCDQEALRRNGAA